MAPVSQACRTCRLRKIKCDLGQPECQRCFTTGRTCLGYGRDFTFKVRCSTDWSSRTNGRWHVYTTEQTQSEEHKIKREATSPIISSPSEEEEEEECHDASPTLLSTPDQKALSCELFTKLFLDLFMPAGYESKMARNPIAVPGGWVSAFPTLFHGRNDLLNKSLLALYTGFVGRRNGDDRLFGLGSELYADAMHLLRQSEIWTSNKRQPDIDAKLASVIVFSRCELFTAEAGSGGYMAHVRGGLQLLKRFATKLPNNDLSKMMVKKFRILGFYASVRHRRAFFMSDPPYNKLYLAEPGDPDYVIQRGFESVIEMPTLLEWADKLDDWSCNTKTVALRGQRTVQDLLLVASKMLKTLQAWRDEMSDAIGHPVPNGPTAPPGIDSFTCQSGGLRFAKPGDNFIWILYWMFALYLNLMIKQLEDRHRKLAKVLAHPLQLPLQLEELALDYEVLDQYAENIRASLFSGFQTSAFDAQERMAPAFTLQWYYEQRGDIAKTLWCIDAIRSIEQQGLTLDVEIKEVPSWCPRVRARFLQEVEG